MANLIFNGYSFNTSLKKTWFLQNLFPPSFNDELEMGFELLNYLDQGFGFNLSTYNLDNKFKLYYKDENNISFELFSIHSNSDNFDFFKGLNLNNKPLINTKYPTQSNEVINKQFFDDKINGELIALSQINTLGLVYRTGDSLYSTKPFDGSIGQVLTLDTNLNPIWASSIGTGDVVGPSDAVNNQISLFSGSTGKLIKSSTITIDANNRINNVADPISNQDVATKKYIDNLISSKFRVGTVYVGDIGGGAVASLAVTGAITAGSKSDAPYTSGDSFVNINFEDKGHIPLIFLSWYDSTTNSSCNDLTTIAIQDVTNTTAKFYLEETNSSTQHGTLNVFLVNPTI